MAVKKALLVGCTYPGQGADTELKGSCNDARRMCTLLKTRFGFPGENIDVLVDDTPPSDMSTHANIRKYLNKLVGGAQSGDTLVFYFSGHGGLLGRDYSTDNSGWNEAIFPNDMTNPITDDDIRIIVNQIPAGVNFTFISDCCCSGGLIDEMKEQVGDAEGRQNFDKQFRTNLKTHVGITLKEFIAKLNNTKLLEYTVDETNYMSAVYELHQENASVSVTACQHGQLKPQCCKSDDVGVLLSGCESWESSLENPGDEETPAYGEFTKAIEKVVGSASKSPSNREMVDAVRALLQSEWDQNGPYVDPEEGESTPPQVQHPCLYCSDANVDKVFICDFVESPAQ